MARRGRKFYQDQPSPWEVSIPKSVADQVEEALIDPLTGKVKYGARAELVTRLLRQWLKDRVKVRDELGELTLDDLNKTV